MPIYEQLYRPHEARTPLRTIRFWPISREALRLLLARRLFLLLMVSTWVPFVGFAIYVYAIAQVPDVRRIAPLDGSVFARFLEWQMRLCLLPTVFAASGLVANDLRTGAILVYLARPLTRRDYIVGKLLVPLGLNLSATLLPGVALYGIAVSMAPDLLLRWERAWILPAIVTQSVLISLTLSLVAVAISALSRSGRVAGIAFVGLLIGLETLHGVVMLLTHRPEAAALSLTEDLNVVGRLLFGVADRGAVVSPTAYALVALAGAGAACLAILRSKVRAVEVVR